MSLSSRVISGGRWRSGPFRMKVVDDGKPRKLTREAQAEIKALRKRERVAEETGNLADRYCNARRN